MGVLVFFCPKIEQGLEDRGRDACNGEMLSADNRLLGEGKWGRKKNRRIPQSVRETNRDDSKCVPSQEKLFKTRDLELLAALCGIVLYTRTSVHLYFPVANDWPENLRFRVCCVVGYSLFSSTPEDPSVLKIRRLQKL